MAKVTVVVPIYQVEQYLRACFESLLKQTSDDFVVLAINDGSPDGCGAIIEEYVKKYPEKIMGIEKKNGGYGSVLQLAIQEMKTPYFIVCDADDTLEAKAIETLLEMASLSGADITIGAKMILHAGSNIKNYDASYNKDYVKLQSNTVYNKGTEEFNDLFFVNPSPHAKLYKRSLAQGLRFPEHTGYTDNLLFYGCLLKSEKVIYTEEPLANYLIDREGNTMTDIRPQAMNGQIMVFKSIVNQAEKMQDVPDIFWYRMFESFKFMLYESRNVKCSEGEYDELLNYLKTFLEKLTPHYKQIKPYYRNYTKAALVEKTRDESLFHPKRISLAYASLKRKMMKEFQERNA